MADIRDKCFIIHTLLQNYLGTYIEQSIVYSGHHTPSTPPPLHCQTLAHGRVPCYKHPALRTDLLVQIGDQNHSALLLRGGGGTSIPGTCRGHATVHLPHHTTTAQPHTLITLPAVTTPTLVTPTHSLMSCTPSNTPTPTY